jgi:uncharacterized protein YbaR (Trm112 family)
VKKAKTFLTFHLIFDGGKDRVRLKPQRSKKMGYIYCPVCSRAISSQANIKACPNCYQPLNVHEWKEARTKRVAKDLEDKVKMLTTKDNLKTINNAQLIQAYNIQKRTHGWTFYNENDIVQRTLENRFNFLLVVFTLFLGAFFQSECDIDKLAILIIGIFLIWFLRLGIRRTTNRFNITLDIVHSLEENDVSPIIHKENGCRHPNEKKHRNNSIMGKTIPNIMFYSIIIGIIIYVVKIVLIILKILPKTSAESCIFWSLLEKWYG